ncbi:MAG: HD domain-containing phosphohydrolase [Phycisphaerae bacterium]|jgi:HD-GYP domain-containing protein (c-di-GMP phosphodiesterase class II)
MLKTAKNRLSSGQLKQVKDFGRDMADLGVNFLVYDTDLNIIIQFNGEKFISDYEAAAACAKQVCESEAPAIYRFGKSGQIVASDITINEMTAAVIVIDCGTDSPLLQESIAYVEQILKMFLKTLQNELRSSQQMELISNELAQTYEELMLLYKMSTNMKVSQSDSNYLQMACDSLIELVNVEGIAIFLEKKINNSKKLVLTAGTGLIALDHKNGNMHEVLFERLLSELQTGSDALLDSEVDAPFKYDWFGRVRNIIAVPLHSNDKTIGMMVATNRLDKADFDSIDVKLFNSVATECAVFIENQSLFRDLKELFIGSLKALTNSIDAKDQYTRGHSERVAFISKWIAEQYAQTENMSADDIQKIYLAGLLHDIGKIGISEAVLRKPGKLTDEEYDQIKTHPAISAGILSEIRQMADIVPGVLCHHERYDGRGYPKGVKGDDIPVAGKIVMIADTFDAMTSKRTYRDALSIETAIEEIRRGLGTQFDPKIGSLFINSDVEKLWAIMQNGGTDDLDSESFNDYGTVAVGALLR